MSQASAQGAVQCIPSLADVQGKAFDQPVVLIAEQVRQQGTRDSVGGPVDEVGSRLVYKLFHLFLTPGRPQRRTAEATGHEGTVWEGGGCGMRLSLGLRPAHGPDRRTGVVTGQGEQRGRRGGVG